MEVTYRHMRKYHICGSKSLFRICNRRGCILPW